MKVILLTFIIADAFEGRTKRLTCVSSDKFFEDDVNRTYDKLRPGQQLIAVDTYTFIADLQQVNALWKELRLDQSLSWRERVDKLKATYPSGLEQYLKV